MNRIIIVAVFLGTVMSCNRPFKGSPNLRSDDKLVYSVLADSIYRGPSIGTTARVIFVLDSTVQAPPEKQNIVFRGNFGDSIEVAQRDLQAHLQGRFPSIEWPEIWQDFDRVNSTRYGLDSSQLQFSRPHIMVAWQIIRDREKRMKGWVRPGQEGPTPAWLESGGLLCVSRVGYNSEHDEAILYALVFPPEHGMNLCFAVLKRTTQGWAIQYLLSEYTMLLTL